MQSEGLRDHIAGAASLEQKFGSQLDGLMRLVDQLIFNHDSLLKTVTRCNTDPEENGRQCQKGDIRDIKAEAVSDLKPSVPNDTDTKPEALKALADTAAFLKTQKKIPDIQENYADFVNPSYARTALQIIESQETATK